jgi:hypothetical protein
MRARFWVWVVLLSAIPLFSQAGPAPDFLRVHEQKMRLSLRPHFRLDIPVTSKASQSFAAIVHLEFIKEQDTVAETADLNILIASGAHTLAVPLDFESDIESPSDLYWWRVRYRISPAVPGTFPIKEGVVPVSRIISSVLSLEAAAMPNATRGATLPVRVRVEDVISHKGVGGAAVEARFDGDDETPKESLARPARTDAEGYALLDVKIPADADTSEDLKITAHRGRWKVSQSLHLNLADEVSLTLSTDKPIYQPGQTLHMRLLALGANNHAQPDEDVVFTIEDEDDDTQFKQKAQTSKFGIARADWEIPIKLRPGHYRIEAELTKNEARTASEVHISRYDLPEFTVTPTTDKPYYLSGQQPHVEVAAAYLFGQPVRRGSVRIVRDNGSHWNSQTRNYEPAQEDLQQGDLDPSGKFSSTLDLTKDFTDLTDSDYRRYEDVRFAAYVTDKSTNRTEQKHFTVRISKELIHLYVVNPYWGVSEPPDIYITAAYPDGTPASVDVTVSAVKPDSEGDFPDEPAPTDLLRLAHVHTNRYGIAHLHANPLPKAFVGATSYYGGARLLLEGSDSHGGHGKHSEHIWLDSGDYFSVKPVKRLFAAGETVTASIESSAPDQTIFADLLSENKVLSSSRVQLHDGHAQVEFPYDPEFRGSLFIVAYNMKAQSSEHDNRNLRSSAEVLFPEPQTLEVGVHLERTTYKPGEDASAEFRVRDPRGRAVQTALGVVIYDKAVAERVRSDEEFGAYGFYYGFGWDRYAEIGGIRYADLLNHKLTGPVSPDLELVAEAMLIAYGGRGGYMNLATDTNLIRMPGDVYENIISKSLAQVDDILHSNYVLTGLYPSTEEEFRSLLSQHKYSFDSARDPWGMPYRLRFSTDDRNAVLEIVSDGPDKTSDTRDDFTVKQYTWPFFTSPGKIMDSAMLDYAQGQGKYIRDLPTLRAQMALRGIDLDSLRDPWGHPYSFTFAILGPQYVIHVWSGGGPGSKRVKHSSDALVVWQSLVHCLLLETKQIDAALVARFRSTGEFPANESEFRALLDSAGIVLPPDPWGNPYHFNFEQTSHYSNRVDIRVYSVGNAEKLVPVTQTFAWIHIVSYGPHNDPHDKFDVAQFNRLMTEQSSKDPVPHKVMYAPMNGSSGAINGTVTDQSGAVIAGVTVTATNDLLGLKYQATTDESGVYRLANLQAGQYRLSFTHPGFKETVVTAVPVMSSNVTSVDVTLQVGTVSETVEVVSAAPVINTASTSMAQASAAHEAGVARVHTDQQVFTPRLRKYFPETLLWQPELITDSSGKAQLKFAMADNITTWKMSVIGSTVNGQLGLAEKELRTFQPFFIDHEPPKILTQGDQIELPVVLRNYLNKTQQVNVNLDPSVWFKPLSALQEHVSVPAGQDATAKFLISADRSVHEGKERITAANHDTGDAIERTLTVHPDGEELTQVLVRFISSQRSSLELQVPQNTIPGSIDAQLKIFPNFGAHVLDSLRGMVARPAGCGEQVTSIAFASLMVLQVLHKAGQDDPAQPGNPNAELASRARRYMNQAYEQLRTFQDSNGGIPFWLHDPPNLALTAYVLDFLSQASQFIDVDPEFLKRIRNYLVSAQQKDGSWMLESYYGRSSSDSYLTAEIAHSLAALAKVSEADPATDSALSKAMDYLRPEINDRTAPYTLGHYILAAVYSHRQQDVEFTRKILASLVHEEGDTVYWNLEVNMTPFYSWGLPGRLETTAIALQALAELADTSHDPHDVELIKRGLLFVFAHKDRYGVWYSTYASANVLRAIVVAMPQFKITGSGGIAQIIVNGKSAGEVHLPVANEVAGPVFTDISSLLAPGANKIEVVRPDDGSLLQAQIVSSHYIPWQDSHAGAISTFKPGESRALRLRVTFDGTESQVGNTVRCNVEMERIGFEGYGMLLAEIGLPPGADVDRESLQKAQTSFAISQYEVLPDRIVVYAWPRPGGTRFSFDFKPRFAMNALTEASSVYDYYNPESRATVAPTRFHVK